MQYWLAAFAVALVIVIGYAAGPPGALVALIVFAVALYLLWARELGFKGAWDRFGIQALTPPLWKPENIERLKGLIADDQKSVKACTIAVALIAVSQLLPRNMAALVFLAVVVWGVFEVYRANSASSARTGNPIH
jgi:hypothetical protein